MRLMLALAGLLFAGCEPARPAGVTMDARSLQLLQLNSVSSYRGLRAEGEALVVFVHDDADRPAVLEFVPEAVVRPRPARRDTPLSPSATADDAFIDGVASFDVDETTNYFRYGIWKASALVPLQDRLAELGISLEQVIIRVERPYVAL